MGKGEKEAERQKTLEKEQSSNESTSTQDDRKQGTQGDESNEDVAEFQTGFMILVPHDRGPLVVNEVPAAVRKAMGFTFAEELSQRIAFSVIVELYHAMVAEGTEEKARKAMLSIMAEARAKANPGGLIGLDGKRIN